MSVSVRFGDRQVGDGHPCFVTYEAGPTHDGLDSAQQLTTLAADAGADAIKFQIIDPDRLVADRKIPFSYDVLVDRETGRTETVTEPLYDILCRRVLSQDEWCKLKMQCDDSGIAFFATALFEDEIDFLVQLGCDSVKIASADVNHFPLIRRAARSGMCLQLDTGNASIGEIELAVDVARNAGAEDLIIHHCPSGYPARLDSINLRIITTLKKMLPFPVAFSDHSPGWEMDIAAIALGANLVEKTITLDRTTPSVEHVMSLEPSEVKTFIGVVKDLETALGMPRRMMTETERERRGIMRRSAWLLKSASAGTEFRDLAIEYRRPGDGLGPDVVDLLAGRRIRCDLPAGHQLDFGDIE